MEVMNKREENHFFAINVGRLVNGLFRLVCNCIILDNVEPVDISLDRTEFVSCHFSLNHTWIGGLLSTI